jgi:hypothetical protein
MEFLSDDQVAAYGRFAGAPERAELGASAYTHVSYQHATFHTKVITSTSPEIPYMPDGILGNQTWTRCASYRLRRANNSDPDHIQAGSLASYFPSRR